MQKCLNNNDLSMHSTHNEGTINNYKSPKFEVNDRVRITKYVNIFSTGYTESWSKETFITNFVSETNPWT